MRDSLRAGTHAALLLAALGALVWATGEPFLFPSLGPSAYILAVHPERETSQPKRVIGGHLLGVVAGLLAYTLLAAPFVGTAPPPAASFSALRLAASAVLSVGLTTTGMLVSDLRHAPACASTLIVSLGLLSTGPDAVVIVLGVVGLVVVHQATNAVQSSVARAIPG